MRPEQSSILVAWLAVMLAIAARDNWIGRFIAWGQKLPSVGGTSSSGGTVPPGYPAGSAPAFGGSQ